MSYFIAKSITITPDKIYYVGCDNNIYPHYDGHFEKDLTWQNMRYLINDLVGWCILPSQQWWMSISKQLQERYAWEEIIKNDDMAEEAMLYVITSYNANVIENHKRIVKDNPDTKFVLIPMPRKS